MIKPQWAYIWEYGFQGDKNRLRTPIELTKREFECWLANDERSVFLAPYNPIEATRIDRNRVPLTDPRFKMKAAMPEFDAPTDDELRARWREYTDLHHVLCTHACHVPPLIDPGHLDLQATPVRGTLTHSPLSFRHSGRYRPTRADAPITLHREPLVEILPLAADLLDFGTIDALDFRQIFRRSERAVFPRTLRKIIRPAPEFIADAARRLVQLPRVVTHSCRS